MKAGIVIGLFLVLFAAGCRPAEKEPALLNVSYDATREFYKEFNPLFDAHWAKQAGARPLRLRQSHGGSGKQARSVIDGLRADVVSLALAYDIDMLAEKAALLPTNWQSRLPHNSAPYFSTVVFLVRGGNPKGIKDWPDLARPGLAVVTPNPKTSGGARWSYLAAYGSELKRTGGDHAKARDFVRRLYANVPVLDSGARAATVSFVERGIGDVLLCWESEALTSAQERGRAVVEVVVPPMSIRAEPPVAVVDKTADRRGTRAAAQAYVDFLYAETAQELAAKHHLRPTHEAVAPRTAKQFPKLTLFTLEELFGTWRDAQQIHFREDGVFDQVYFLGRKG